MTAPPTEQAQKVKATVKMDGTVECKCGRFLMEIDPIIAAAVAAGGRMRFPACKNCRQIPYVL